MNKKQIKELVQRELKKQVVQEDYVPEELYEKLTVSQGIEAWIKDFQQSDAPQVKGKNKEMRRKMAVAAYKAAERKENPSKDRRKNDRRKGDRRKSSKKSDIGRTAMKHSMAIDALDIAGKLAFLK